MLKRKSLIGITTGATVLGALAAYVLALRPWHLGWGATDAELKEPLPGDDLVPSPKGVATHAITIQATLTDVWPWLVQIGQDKGGFYSYSWLENLVGCRLHNADRVMPEFQHLQAGDVVRLHPKAPPLPVVVCEPYRAIVLGSNTKNPGTWGFYLKEINGQTTRLIMRGRGDWQPSLAAWLCQYVLFEPAHFIMEQKMMRGIKRRAEALAAARTDRQSVHVPADRHEQSVA